VQLKQALVAAVQQLESADIRSPRLNAETLLMFMLGVNRAYIYAHPERDLTADGVARYEELIRRRSTGLPAQYITGHQEFWGLDLIVSPAVLIPRPETEHLVETVVELAREVPAPRIVDVGTGSGCIALALAHELKTAEVFGVDLSAEALEIARANAARLQLEQRVKFLCCDVLTPLSENSGVCHPERSDRRERSRRTPFAGMMFHDLDFVVSNPPYVSLNEADKVQRSVLEFEPHMAVFGGDKGLDVLNPLIHQSHTALKPGGYLAMEIGYSMRDAVLKLLSSTMWEEPKSVPDLQGIPRVVVVRKRPVPA